MIAKSIWFAGFLLFTSPALAHEFWIEPAKFHPDPAERIELRLRVGERFEGQPVTRKNERIKTFAFFEPQHELAMPISGNEGDDPAGVLAIGKSGLYTVGYYSTPTRIELDPKKFEEYLKEEGLDSIIEQRKQLGESDRPGREMYARCAKALLLSGPVTDAGLGRRFGFPLELTPRSNPFALMAGQEFIAQLVFHNKPVAGVKVSAIRRGAFDKAVSARTDQEGLVRLPLDEPGPWLIAAVHMTRAEKDADVEWQSLWASLTFEQLPAERK